MKKICLLICAMLLCQSMLIGCSGTGSDEDKDPISTESSEVSTSSDEPEESDESETPATSEMPQTDADGSSAPPPFEVVDTSIESPAKIGEWVASKKYSPVDKLDHTVYYRVTNVVRGAQDAVDAYNEEGHVVTLTELDDENLEYCMVEYEVYFPEDFPQRDYGITDIEIDFGLESPDGGGFDYNGVTYIGLSTVWDISEDPETDEFFAGDTFTEGKGVFAMLKEYDDYVFEVSYLENGESVYSYVEGK